LGVQDANEELVKRLESITNILKSIEKDDATLAKNLNGLLTKGGTGLTTS
jgi:hypothetical protein